MSVIGGSQPIITSGLVYGLDFGNTRTYTAGNTTARSLAYDTAPPSVISGSYGASYTADNKSLILLSTTSNYIQRTGSISAFDPQGNFTVCLFLNIATSGPFFVQNQTSVNFAIQSNTSSFDIGFYNPTTGNYYTRRYPTLLNTGSVYLACRYASGSMDLFVNGLPVTSSQADISIPAIVTGSYSTSILYKDIAGSTYIGATPGYISSFSGSFSQMLVYNKALTSTEIYSNYIPHVTSQYQLAAPSITKPYTLDENTLMYVSASGVTSSAYITAIDNFVTGLKSAGIWNKLGAVYPVVGSTTSSQALNLKEPGVNRLVYSGSWTATTSGSYPSSSTSLLQLPGFNYPTIATSSAHITYLSYDLPQVTASLVGVDKPLRALGGEIYYSGSRIYHAFKITGTSSFQVLDSGLTAVDVLVVAGGGSGGSRDAGGGGAGGLIYSSSFAVTTGAYNVVVGSGGREVGYTGTPERGNSGENSTFSTITSFGGGSGGGYGLIAGNGGSGGGAGGVGSPGTGSAGQGNNGGTTAFAFTGGGGGGAGSAGQNAPSNEIGGAGGSGSFFAQYAGLPLGSPAGWFAGGGGGGGGNGGGAGGIGGGGAQNPGSSGQASSGVVNTGGGGGTARIGGVLSGTGGSGIVIISYSSSQAAFTSSFGLSISGSNIVGNLHSTTTSGITGGGIVGLVTVSRTGSTNISLHQDVTSSIISAPVTASILGSVYGNASNYAGVPSKFGTTTLSYLSYGAGLAPSEVSSYHNLVSKLQYDLGRGLLIQGYPAAAAYSVRQLSKTARYAMTVRRDSDNLTFDVGFDSNGNLNTGSLLTNMTASLNTPTLPGDYSGLAAAYSLRRVSSSYTGSAIDVRRDWDNTTGSIGFDSFGNLNTSSLLSFVGYENLITQSQPLPGPWIFDPGVQLQTNIVTAPDGTLTGNRVYNIPGGYSIYKGFSFPAGSYVLSYYIKAVPGDEGKTIGVGGGTTLITLTSNWVRYSASFSTNLIYEIGTKGGATATQYYIWGTQINTGSSATIYTPTFGISASAATGLKSGYVAQWYDQSINGKHATQTVTGSQPLIVSSGSLITSSFAKPSVKFDGVDDYLDIATITVTSQSIFSVQQNISGKSVDVIFGSAGSDYYSNNIAGNLQVTNTSAQDIFTGGYNTTSSITSYHRDGIGTISGSAYLNGSRLTQTGTGITTQAANYSDLGGFGSFTFQGFISEFVLYNNSKLSSRSLIEDNINGYYNIFTQSLASSSGYVTQWYDQSGNGNHATQSTSAYQPIIVSSGSLITSSGKPALQLDGTDDYLYSDFNTVSQPNSYFIVSTQPSTQYGFIFDSTPPNRQAFLKNYNDNAISFGTNTAGIVSANGTTVGGTRYLYSALANGTNSYVYTNNILIASGNIDTGGVSDFYIGTRYSLASFGNIKIQELILHSGNQTNNRSLIESNINSYYNIY